MPTVVVTGANSEAGIGYAFVNLLCDEGYTVYAVDRDHGEGLKSLASKAHTAVVDVTSPESIKKFKESLGDVTIDILLNVAGQTNPGTRCDCFQRVTKYRFRCCLGATSGQPHHDQPRYPSAHICCQHLWPFAPDASPSTECVEVVQS